MNPQLIQLIKQAVTYLQQGKVDDAERLLKQVLRLAPKHPEVMRLLAVILAQKRDLAEALKMIDSSIKIDNKNYLAHSNKGNILKDLYQYKSALESYDRAIALQPNYAEAHNNKGNLLMDMNQLEPALESYGKAIALQPNYAEAYSNMGNALRKQNSLDKALEAYEKSMAVGGSIDPILNSYVNLKMQLCNWDGIEDQLKCIQSGDIQRKDRFFPFCLLAVCDDPYVIKQITTEYMEALHPIRLDLGQISNRPRKEKIRIGYFSPDFKNHPVAYLMAEVIELHNRDQFEVIAFSMGQGGEEDVMRQRLELGFDQFIDVVGKSDKDVALLSRELEIDIAVDLGGLTEGSSPSIFAFRAAPIQISYIGYLSTMAAPYMDYIISDSTLIPEEAREAFSEKIIYLPSYQANDSKRPVIETIFTREDLGLPSKGFVFCSFNNSFKLTPGIFDSWARILKQVEGSVLYLYAENEVVKKNLSQEIERRGVNSERLIFGEKLSREDYLARYRVADLFLDTSPYNAGTTASDALWMGLPVITFTGKSFSARMCASILNAIGLSELIADSLSSYEALAISLAGDPVRMKAIKDKLKSNIGQAPLFNSKLFTQNLETAYQIVYERYQENLPPENIYVA